MTTFLAVDPGSHRSGWALAVDGRIVASGAVTASRLGILAQRIAELDARLDWKPAIDELIIERHPVTYRRDGQPTDAWGPGIAAGLWVAAWHTSRGVGSTTRRPPEPRMVTVAEWRRAMLGRGVRGRAAAKAAAKVRARAELADVGLSPTSTGSAIEDEYEAVCLAVYAASRSAEGWK